MAIYVELKGERELTLLRAAGRVVARALAVVREHAGIGVRLAELDQRAGEAIAAAGARPSLLDYHPHFAPTPYPAVLCASVNDTIVHGIPNDYRLADGDVLSVDCAAELAGFHADAAFTMIVGQARPEDEALVAATRRALAAGIDKARPGARLGDVSHVVGGIGRRAGYGIPPDLGGHGVGRALHEEPSVPNDGPPGVGPTLCPGLVLAIEPIFLAGGQDRYRTAADGWTLCTVDGSRSAHFEHTVAITEDGPVVLTEP
jgi:methionyl aminopeptidase